MSKNQQETETLLPSEHQIGDSVWLCFWSNAVAAWVHAVHFYGNRKVKYDLNVYSEDGKIIRLYSVLSDLVKKTTAHKPVNG